MQCDLVLFNISNLVLECYPHYILYFPSTVKYPLSCLLLPDGGAVVVAFPDSVAFAPVAAEEFAFAGIAVVTLSD